MQSPWGTIQDSVILAPGIVSVSTAGHGGIVLDAAHATKLRNVPNFLHNSKYWEEDCDWCVPYVVFANEIRAHGTAYRFEDNLKIAIETAIRHHPEIMSLTEQAEKGLQMA